MPKPAVSPFRLGHLFGSQLQNRGPDLGEALGIVRAWPEVTAPISQHDNPVASDSALVLLLAKLSGEAPSALVAAMNDPDNVAGRCLRTLEHQLVAPKGSKRGRVGRPPNLDKVLAHLLGLNLPTTSTRSKWEGVKSGLNKLGVEMSAEQAREAARKSRKEMRGS